MTLKTFALILFSLSVGAGAVVMITHPWEAEVVRMPDTIRVSTLEKECAALSVAVNTQSNRADKAESMYSEEAGRHKALRKKIAELNSLHVALAGQLELQDKELRELKRKASQVESYRQRIDTLEADIERLKGALEADKEASREKEPATPSSSQPASP